MKQAEDSVWYEWAKENMDVEKIVTYFLQNHEVVKEYQSYIQNEEMSKNNLVHHLAMAGLAYDDMEDIMLRYGGMIQNIYLELGLKIGARLGVEYLDEIFTQNCKGS